MNSVKSMIMEYGSAMWRWRWYAAAAAWAVCIAGWTFVALMPNTYQAKARIYVDTDTMLRPLLRGIAVDTNLMNEVDLMQRTLLSRPNLQKVSRLADLDLNAKTAPQQEAVIVELQRRLKISSQGRNLFELSFEGPYPETAKKVVQSLLDIFVEGNLGNSRKDMIAATTFINEQIREYERQLEQAEGRVAEFKSQNLGFLPGDNNYMNRLEASRQEMARTQGELAESRKKRDEMKKQLAEIPKMIEQVNVGSLGPDLGPPIGGAPGMPAGLRVPELEQQLKTLRLRFTDRHPDVVEVKRLLELAKKEAEERAAKEAEGESSVPQATGIRSTSSNPVYEQLKLQLVQMETTIASLENRLERNNAEVAKWEKLARSVPGVAAEMARLNRDYDIIKRNYDELLGRREAARIGQDLETQTKGVQFRLIDPAELPTKPTGPNRPLFVSVVMLAGIAAGSVFAFFLSQIDNTLRHVDQVRAAFKLPILGGVSVIRSAWDLRRQRLELASYSIACITLLGAYVGLLSIEAFLNANS